MVTMLFKRYILGHKERFASCFKGNKNCPAFGCKLSVFSSKADFELIKKTCCLKGYVPKSVESNNCFVPIMQEYNKGESKW